MSRARKPPSPDLLGAITDLTPAAVDALYGLEPAFEPDAATPSDVPARWLDVGCPYCGEGFETFVDFSAGTATYVEDCPVCCRPIEMACTVDESGELVSFRAGRLD